MTEVSMIHRDGDYEPNESGTFRIAPPSAPSGSLGAPTIGPDTSERDLVLALIAGDGAAWREFERRYARLVRRCIGNVTRRAAGLTSEDDREIHATFVFSLLVHDMKRLRAFDPDLGHPLSGWIGRLAVNCAHDYVRRTRTRREKPAYPGAHEPGPEACPDLEEPACDRPDPFEQAVAHERAQMAARTLEGFSEIDRRFAALYFGEGLPPAEVARSLNISLNTVYSKRCKIQSRLEAALASAKEADAAA
jgi:RNA polymerase sigma-70 factor (ECF subfamily)